MLGEKHAGASWRPSWLLSWYLQMVIAWIKLQITVEHDSFPPNIKTLCILGPNFRLSFLSSLYAYDIRLDLVKPKQPVVSKVVVCKGALSSLWSLRRERIGYHFGIWKIEKEVHSCYLIEKVTIPGSKKHGYE